MVLENQGTKINIHNHIVNVIFFRFRACVDFKHPHSAFSYTTRSTLSHQSITDLFLLIDHNAREPSFRGY